MEEILLVRFDRSCKVRPDHRHEEQFFGVKDETLRLAEGERMASEVGRAYADALEDSKRQPLPFAEAVQIAGRELDAFVFAVQVHESEEKGGTAKPGARKRLCKAAKTILGSVKELFKLSEFGKAVLKILEEPLPWPVAATETALPTEP